MLNSRDRVFDLLTSEFRQVGYHPVAAELKRMRAFLEELDAAAGRISILLVLRGMLAHRHRVPGARDFRCANSAPHADAEKEPNCLEPPSNSDNLSPVRSDFKKN